MRTILTLSAVAVLLVAPGPCFALWGIYPVTPKTAKELGLEVRSTPAGPDMVRIELEFKLEGQLKGFSRVDLRIGDGDKDLVIAPLQEDRSKPGRVVVGFAADRTRLDRITLCVMVPESHGGTVYEARVKDFVEPAKDK
jgi:hypothetical protein